MAELGKARVYQHEGSAFESHFGHGLRGASIIRRHKMVPDTAKWMTPTLPTYGSALSGTGGQKGGWLQTALKNSKRVASMVFFDIAG